MMWGYGWGVPGFLMMGFAGLIWLALLGLAIFAVVRLLGSRASAESTPVGGPSAMEILRQRYARGEIDDATFAQMRERLEGGQDNMGVRVAPPEAPPPDVPTGSTT
ncbi:MAG TPA: SHOCT domain-containing protein [Ktedonobacterales bacterium]|nr:SHOCT domain-containing protein [Ktedonobacterales bacterium]